MSIGSTTTNRIGAGLTSTNNFNFKGSILEFRTYEGALALLDVAVLDAFGPDHPQTNPGTPQAVRLVTPSTTGPGAVFRAGVFADFSAVTNVNISIQPDLVLTSDNTNVIAIAPDNRLQTLTLGAANITAMWQGFSNTVALTVGVPQDIALIHRFGFNEQTNDWIMHDSVGEAPGMLFNTGAHAPTNAVFTGNGEMNLSGGFSYYRGGYATLPPRIISSLSEVSIEAWVTWTRPLDALVHYEWQRIFDFGTFIGSTPQSYLFLTPSSNNHLQTTNYAFYFAITTNSLQAEKPRLVWTNTLPLNVTSFLAVTYSPIRGLAKMYLNGALVASDVATIPLSGIIDNNNCLGRSQWSNDPNFGGRYNEFRIYSGLLSDADVAADYAAGPDVVGVDYVLHNYYVPTNSLTITWGLSATNWYLESSPSLGPGAVWNPVPITPLQNGRNNVTVPVSGDAAFFRLHAP
jgi:hypothetical protein